MDTGKKIFKGIGVTSKKASGKLRLFDFESSYTKAQGKKLTRDEEKSRFLEAVSSAVSHTEEIAKRARETLGESEAQIFEIHEMLLEDEDFIESALLEIDAGLSAEETTAKSGEKYSRLICSLGDEYLSARAADIKDICASIIDSLRKKTENS